METNAELSLSFRLVAWEAETSGRNLSGQGDRQDAKPPPASLRRRITPVGRSALAAAWSLHTDGESPRLIFSSRHGEYERIWSLLHSLAESGEVSPAEFSLSVHHALAGLLSIATGNRAGHTAIAAGVESFGYGLLEAVAAMTEDAKPVLFVHFDDALPEAYGTVAGDPAGQTIIALGIAPVDTGDGEMMVLSVLPGEGTRKDDLAERFIQFLETGQPEGEARGERMLWRWRRAA